MLKTTTETGDIGVFSIGPTLPASSSATYHHGARQRRKLNETNWQRQPRHPGTHEGYRDDRKRLPSYRDTTSEIISLYGSDTQRSYSRSFSPSIDESRRSYSLTTCSSQHLPSHKSFATLQSYNGVNGHDRSRSPFPYPTRLKRPDLRTSPPFTGGADSFDQGKTGRGDRPSQRTRSESHKASRFHSSPAFPPMVLHSETPSRSTSSLSVQPQTQRAWSGLTRRSHERLRTCSKEHSLRTASLTSIVEMYQGPCLSDTGAAQPAPIASFYYDYTEGFEKHKPIAPRTPEPVCPIPQRSDGGQKPLVLRQEADPALDAPPIMVMSETTDCQSMGSTGIASSELRSSHESEEESCGCGTDLVPDARHKLIPETQPWNECGHQLAQETVRSTLNAEQQDQEITEMQDVHKFQAKEGEGCLKVPTDRSASMPMHEISPPDTQPISANKTLNPANTWAGELRIIGEVVPKRESQGSRGRLRGSLDPGLVEFAAILASFDRLARSPFSKAGDDTYISTKESRNAEDTVDVTAGPNSGATEVAAFYRKHRRNFANLINADNAKPMTQTIVNSKDGQAEPSQRSAIRTLLGSHRIRPKISFSQLMKPLPPLPGEATCKASEFQARVIVKESKSTGIPRLKLRAKKERMPEVNPRATEASGMPRDKSSIPPVQSPSPGKRLRLTRAHLGTGSPRSDTVVRSPALKQYNALAEFQHCTRKDLFSPQISLAEPFIPPKDHLAPEVPTIGLNGESTRSSPQPSDQFDIPYPTTSEEVSKSPPATEARLNAEPSEVPACSVKELGGLRQKLSMLQVHITGKRLAAYERSLDGIPVFRKTSISSTSLRLKEPECVDAAAECGTSSATKKHGQRVKRWADNARKVVRWYVKKALDRNSRPVVKEAEANAS